MIWFENVSLKLRKVPESNYTLKQSNEIIYKKRDAWSMIDVCPLLWTLYLVSNVTREIAGIVWKIRCSVFFGTRRLGERWWSLRLVCTSKIQNLMLYICMYHERDILLCVMCNDEVFINKVFLPGGGVAELLA